MAQYTIFGYIKDSTCTPVVGAKVYPYFKKVDSSSPDSKWSDAAYTTDSNGYYSFNLGDNVLLGSESGIKKTSDKVYIAVVYGGDELLTSLDLTNALFVDHTTINDDFFELNLDIPEKRSPVINSHTFPTAVLTQHNYTMSESVYSDTGWVTDGCYDTSVSQKLLYDNVDIFDGHQLINTIYSWHEIADREVAVNTSDSYTFVVAGDYTLKIRSREKWNTFTESEQVVRIKYNVPVPEFNWAPTETNSWQGSRIKGQELITFDNLSSDIDNRTWDNTTWGAEAYTYTWTITDELQDGSDNTAVHSGVDYLYKPTHAFQSTGIKTVTMQLMWNDGFDDHIETVVHTLEVYAYDLELDFNWDILNPTNRSETVTFNPDLTTGDVDQITQYDWVIEDNYPASELNKYTFTDTDISVFSEGSADNSIVVDNTYNIANTQYPGVKFHSDIAKLVTLTVHYYNGWESVTEVISKTLVPTKYVVEPTFTISDTTPMGRFVDVVITNTTNYIRGVHDLGYTIDWSISDEYSACNLDNPNSGSIEDNSETHTNVANSTVVNHMYQSIGNYNTLLVIRYDDGWQMITKELTQTVSPEVHPAPVPDITWTPNNPKGRDMLCEISDNTTYDYARYRGVDWTINDVYDACNLDNATPGSIVDNTDTYTAKLHTDVINKYFQSVGAHDIYMKIWYDDGFCEQSVDITEVITTIVYNEPIPEFTWDVAVPTSRDETVTFSDTTVDPDNRFRAYDWNVPDSYNKWNPDSNEYGVAVVDNTQVINYSEDPLLEPTHNFQDNISRDINMVYYYDDGYCEQSVNKTNTITFTEYTINPAIITNITPVNNGFVGMIEVGYSNNSTGDTSSMLDERWEWNDITFPDNLDNIVVRNDQVVSVVQLYTWQYPSRTPYSSVNGSTAQNINKSVELEIRIDNGWRDNTDNDGLGVDNYNSGGVVYYVASETYEASPKEISSTITYECNVDNYSHT